MSRSKLRSIKSPRIPLRATNTPLRSMVIQIRQFIATRPHILFLSHQRQIVRVVDRRQLRLIPVPVDGLQHPLPLHRTETWRALHDMQISSLDHLVWEVGLVWGVSVPVEIDSIIRFLLKIKY